jgi:tetratricopeptide (TPR) repeat protein
MPELTLEEAPRKVRDLYQKAFAAYERNNLDYAMDLFTSLLELEPNLLQARKYLRAANVKATGGKKSGGLSGMGTVMKIKSAIKKDPREALQLAEKLLRTAPFSKSFLNTYEEAARAAGNLEAAIISYEAAHETYSTEIEFLRKLASLYMDAEQTAKGRSVYETILRMNPKDQTAIKHLKDASALDTMQSGGWTGASSYRDVMKDKKGAELLEQEGRSSKTGEASSGLLAETESKVKREPENMNYRRALAELYIKSSRFADAIQLLQEGMEISGNVDPQIELMIGEAQEKVLESELQVLQDAGDPAAADKEMELEQYRMDAAASRVERYPNDLSYKFNYGRQLYKHDFFNEAAQQFQLSQRSPQKRIESLYYLGLCFKAKGQMDIAIDQLAKAVAELPTMDNQKKDILYDLGSMYEEAGNADEAKNAYKAIYSVDIGYKDVDRKIEGS